MKNVKNILLLFAVMFQLQSFAQDGGALLDKVATGIKNDAPVQMDYSYNVYDDENQLVQEDKGLVCIDNERYALLMENMMVLFSLCLFLQMRTEPLLHCRMPVYPF